MGLQDGSGGYAKDMALIGIVLSAALSAALTAVGQAKPDAAVAVAEVGAGEGGRLEIVSPRIELRLRMVHPKWLSQAYSSGSILPDDEGVTHFDFVREAKGNRAVARRSWKVLRAKGGIVNPPTLEGTLPKGWVYRANANVIRVCRDIGTAIIVR